MAGNRVFYILLLFTAAGIYIFTNTYYTLMLLGLVVLAIINAEHAFGVSAYRQRFRLHARSRMQFSDTA